MDTNERVDISFFLFNRVECTRKIYKVFITIVIELLVIDIICFPSHLIVQVMNTYLQALLI